MPLQSRVNRRTSPVARAPAAPAAGADLNVSPRRRAAGISRAAEDDAPPSVRPDTLDEQEAQQQVEEPVAPAAEVLLDGDGEREEAPPPPPAEQAAAAVAKRVTRKRTVKPKPELPEDLARLLEKEDPAEIRTSLKLIEDAVREKRRAFEEELKVFRTLYRDLSDKLAGTL